MMDGDLRGSLGLKTEEVCIVAGHMPGKAVGVASPVTGRPDHSHDDFTSQPHVCSKILRERLTTRH